MNIGSRGLVRLTGRVARWLFDAGERREVSTSQCALVSFKHIKSPHTGFHTGVSPENMHVHTHGIAIELSSSLINFNTDRPSVRLIDGYLNILPNDIGVHYGLCVYVV